MQGWNEFTYDYCDAPWVTGGVLPNDAMDSHPTRHEIFYLSLGTQWQFTGAFLVTTTGFILCFYLFISESVSSIDWFYLSADNLGRKICLTDNQISQVKHRISTALHFVLDLSVRLCDCPETVSLPVEFYLRVCNVQCSYLVTLSIFLGQTLSDDTKVTQTLRLLAQC